MLEHFIFKDREFKAHKKIIFFMLKVSELKKEYEPIVSVLTFNCVAFPYHLMPA